MSLRCYFGFHRPLLNSIVRSGDRYRALCIRCSCSLERKDGKRWAVPKPLIEAPEAKDR